MKRNVFFLFLLITSALAFGSSRSHLQPPPPAQPTAQIKWVTPDEREVVTTLPTVIITVPARRLASAAKAPPEPEAAELHCGAWQPLASDETQRVRYCEAAQPGTNASASRRR